ncbi:MAG TPA: serine peptidase, partial [Gammaproteobacteria bacterium]
MMRLLMVYPVLVFLLGINANAASLPDFTALVEANKPAVVNISTTRKSTGMHQFLPEEFELPEGSEEGPLGDLLRRFFGAPNSD